MHCKLRSVLLTLERNKGRRECRPRFTDALKGRPLSTSIWTLLPISSEAPPVYSFKRLSFPSRHFRTQNIRGFQSRELQFAPLVNYQNESNEQLLRLCAHSADAEAWEEFVRRFQPLIAGVVMRVAERYGLTGSG